MITVVPIDSKGVTIGAEQRFSNKHWDKMVFNFGKKLRFKIVKPGSSNATDIELVPKVSTKKAKSVKTKADKKAEKEEKAIRKAYHEKFGRWPLRTWKIEIIKKKLDE